MILDAIDESVSVVASIAATLAGVSMRSQGIPAADLHYALNDLVANAEDAIQAATVQTWMLAAFQAATAAGATIVDFENVRTTLVALNLVSSDAILVCNAAIQMVLSQEVAIYASTTFVSRQQVAAAIAQINTAFASAIEYAADNQQPDCSKALYAANSAITQHLTNTERPLPKMITYSFGRSMTSLTLANYLYGDASRADELVAENGVIDPTFMPLSGVALSQ